MTAPTKMFTVFYPGILESWIRDPLGSYMYVCSPSVLSFFCVDKAIMTPRSTVQEVRPYVHNF